MPFKFIAAESWRPDPADSSRRPVRSALIRRRPVSGDTDSGDTGGPTRRLVGRIVASQLRKERCRSSRSEAFIFDRLLERVEVSRTGTGNNVVLPS